MVEGRGLFGVMERSERCVVRLVAVSGSLVGYVIRNEKIVAAGVVD